MKFKLKKTKVRKKQPVNSMTRIFQDKKREAKKHGPSKDDR